MSFLNNLKQATNYTYTDNGALSHKTTGSDLYDLFAFGGAYRSRRPEDKILLFKNAFEENPAYAVKCLFYLRDITKGQGERSFFRTCFRWLIENHYEIAVRNLAQIPEFGRWDDLIYIAYETKAWPNAIRLIRKQLIEDMRSLKTNDMTPVSLLGKWLPSENTSSAQTRLIAHTIRKDLNIDSRKYRRMLTKLRERINIVEKLMSSNNWDAIRFDKLPSKAGFKYRKCFARRAETKERYSSFMSSKETKVNAGTMYPAEIVHSVTGKWSYRIETAERNAINKYWDNLTDYFNGKKLNALAVVDTSGSMRGLSSEVAPIDVAISLGMYCAEKAPGPFHGHYITFSRQASLVKVEGVDFVDKVQRIYAENLCENTNIASVFELILNTAIRGNVSQYDLPNKIIIISDMQFDPGQRTYANTQMETWRKRFAARGYKLPEIVYWNVKASTNQIPDNDPNVTYVSGYSPSIFEQIMEEKTGYDLMMDKLNSDRYKDVG